jgi:hypothetical protein
MTTPEDGADALKKRVKAREDPIRRPTHIEAAHAWNKAYRRKTARIHQHLANENAKDPETQQTEL